jgi:NitT/TauT family transport system permease protein
MVEASDGLAPDQPEAEPAPATSREHTRRGWRRRLLVLGLQLLIVVLFLLAWEELPKIHALSSRFRFLDPFFISSPTAVADKIGDLVTGSNGGPLIWPYVWPTFGAAMLGTVIGLLLGGLAGLVMSSSELLSATVKPFIVCLNAVPRIALIPIIVILVGPGFTSSVVISVLVVFFLALFNAYEGGRTVTPELLHNAEILGASKRQVMSHIRFPYALAWTLATLPVAISFSVLTVVTAEILTGTKGIGRLITTATSTAQASLTFSVVIVLSVITIVIVGVTEVVRRRVLHWWG